MFNVRAVSKGLTRMRVFTPSKSYFLYPLVLVFCNPQYQYIIVSRFWMKISVDPSLNVFKCQSKFYQKLTYLFFMKNSFRVLPSISIWLSKILQLRFFLSELSFFGFWKAPSASIFEVSLSSSSRGCN